MKVTSSLDETKPLRRAYLATRKGLMKVTKYGGPDKPIEFRTVRPIMRAMSLDEVKPHITVDRFEPLPKALVEEIVAVFRAVYKKHGTEMAVALCWENGKYYITRHTFAVVSGAYVRHFSKMPEKMGVIHSHPTFAAAPSGTDDATEMHTPGLYGIFGHVMSDKPEIYMSAAGEFMRHPIEIPDYGVLNPPELSDTQVEWWTKTVMTVVELEGHTDGWKIFDYGKTNALWWCATEEEAKSLAGDLPIDKAERKYVFTAGRVDDASRDWHYGSNSEDDWADWERYFGFDKRPTRYVPSVSTQSEPVPIRTIKKKKKKKNRQAVKSSKPGAFVVVFDGDDDVIYSMASDMADALPADKFELLLEAMYDEWQTRQESNALQSSDAEELDTPYQNQSFGSLP